MKIPLFPAVTTALLACVCASAQNPVISTAYTPDPAPYVHGDKVYLFVDHDEDDATYFKMKDWMLYYTEDMANWTYLGTPVSTETFKWAEQGDNAWASQAVEKDGKWYWYVCLLEAGTRSNTIAVAVADDPQGPYRDALGHPLAKGWSFIDPSIFIDDDGSAYLFWGNKGCWYGKLNDDMISFSDGWKEVPGFHDPKCFGPESMKMDWSIRKEVMMVGYEEGPWVTKRGDIYYMTYPSGGVPEHMAYSTAPTIDGPWTYRGRIMDEAVNSFTIHGGQISFKGHEYMFYHNGTLPNGGGFHRSTCVEEFEYGADGSIPFIPFTNEGVKQLGCLNPYQRVEAETMAASWGLKTDRLAGKKHYVTSVHNGDWIKVKGVDFGDRPATLVTLEMLNFKNPGTVQFYIDEISGAPIASVEVNNANMMLKAPVDKRAVGVHDLYILFRGGDEELFDLDWWKFNQTVNMPLIQTKYTADPAPMVYNGTVYLYTTHDEDYASDFQMKDWLLYTSTDMVNWTDHGAVASLKDFAWFEGDNGAWAEQVVERNGKFYMYCPTLGHGIGVLVADSPYGPFKDPIGKPLVWQQDTWEGIDPTVFVDDDGQAYMYWGHGNVWWVTLNEDMISYSGEIHKLDYPVEKYQEGPWFYKRGDKYYLAFASTCCPEGIGYAMSDSPTGPWKSMGDIMERTWRTRGNHPGIIDFKGKSYVFGLNYDLMHLDTFYHHERRSVSAAEMHYNEDGSIQVVPYWIDNVLEQAGVFDPFRKVEAETMAWGYGLKTTETGRDIYIRDIDDGEYLMIKGADLKKGARKFSANVSNCRFDAAIEIHLDSVDGPLCGTLNIKPTDGFKTLSCSLKNASGVRDLYFVFKGEGRRDLFEWDWWQMKQNN